MSAASSSPSTRYMWKRGSCINGPWYHRIIV